MINYKACIFDLDGTLLDSMGVWKRVDEIFLGRRGLPLTDEYCKAISHMKLDLAADYTAEIFHLDENPEDIIKEWLDLAREEFTYRIQSKPYAAEYLKKLKELKIPIAVATTAQRELYVPALKRLGFYSLFDGFADSELLNCCKDRPDIFLAAAKMLDAEPKDVLVFEDTVHALKTAKQAGFITVGFLDGDHIKDHEEIKKIADCTACDFKDFFEELCKKACV
ncbi:MAG: HAD family phosphatase [Firmicutes bacterium]|nr:HAD family phosphatase [[Eubacterium] siraeum]MCM1487461.1 HAD family phosphatase [Bacillota bacterium]